jgi:hypothetical protein
MKISIDELVIYAVYRIYQSGDECTFERLVYECFTLFPHEFSFKRYPQWPDSARINKSWLRCRTDKGWLVGTVKESFRLTDLGIIIAERVEKKLNMKKVPATGSQNVRVKDRERYDSMLRSLRESDKYKEFIDNPRKFRLNEMSFRQLLGCTLETPLRIIKQNLRQYQYAANVYRETNVVRFLNACETQMINILESKPGGRKG